MKENKNTISTAAVQYATVESLNTEARTRANADSQIRTTIQVLSDDYEDFKENGGGSGGVSKDYVDTQDALKQNITDNTLTTTSKTVVGAINENATNIATKQDTLVDNGDSQNIKTINSQSILGTGDITINGSGSTELDNNIEIYNNEDNNFVQYKTTDLDWTAASDDSLTSKSYVDTQDALKQNITDTTLTTTNKTIVGGINELVTNKQDTLVDSGNNQNIKTINSQSILGTGNITIDSGTTDLDNNIEIYNNEDNNFVQYKTTDLDWTAASDDSLTSKSYVNQQDTTIINSVSQKADTTYVDTQDALKQNITDNTLTTTTKTIVGGINELVTDKQDTLVDSGENQNIKTINGTSLLGTGDIEITGGASTNLDNNIEIYDNEDNNFVQYKATDLDWSAASDDSLTSKSYVNQQDTTITNSVSQKADTTYVDSQNALKQNINDTTLTTTSKTIVGAINENATNIATKQDTLVDNGDSQNIKTINSQSILGTGNITIDSGSKDLDNNIEIYNNEDNNFVQYKTTDLDWTAASDDSLTSKSYVNQQDTTIINSVSQKADTTYVDTQDALKQNITDTTLTTTSKTIVGAINENVTSIGTKQDTLVDSGSSQNIKTINSQSILGTGNITIDSGSTDLDNNIEIYDNENNNFVQYKATNLDWSVASDDSLTSKSYVDTQDALKQNITDTTLTTTSKTIVGAINELVTNKQGTLTLPTGTNPGNPGTGNALQLDSNNNMYIKTDTSLGQIGNLLYANYSTLGDSIGTVKTFSDLNTNSKTIIGGINENLTSIGTKQDTLVDSGNSQNIKTINGQSILGTGNVDISVDGSSPLEDNIEIYNNEDNNFVQYKATDLDWTAASDDSLTSKSYVDQQDTTITNSVSLKADTTYVDTQDALKQNITDTTLTTTSKTIVGAINELKSNLTLLDISDQFSYDATNHRFDISLPRAFFDSSFRYRLDFLVTINANPVLIPAPLSFWLNTGQLSFDGIIEYYNPFHVILNHTTDGTYTVIILVDNNDNDNINMTISATGSSSILEDNISAFLEKINIQTIQ